MNNVVDGLGTLLETFFCLLRRRVGTYNNKLAADLQFLGGKRRSAYRYRPVLP